MEKDFLAVLTHSKTKYGVILEPYPSIPDRIRKFLGGSSFGGVETGGLSLRMKESMGDLGMVRGAGLKYLSFPKKLSSCGFLSSSTEAFFTTLFTLSKCAISSGFTTSSGGLAVKRITSNDEIPGSSPGRSFTWFFHFILRFFY
jgi:hypothetical protein